jgi:hypothetical protein
VGRPASSGQSPLAPARRHDHRCADHNGIDEQDERTSAQLASIFHRGDGCGPELQPCDFDHVCLFVGRAVVRLSRRCAGFHAPAGIPFMIVGVCGCRSGRCGQCLDGLPGVDHVGGPGPVRAEVQPACAVPAGEPGGEVPQPVAQQFRGGVTQVAFGEGEVAVAVSLRSSTIAFCLVRCTSPRLSQDHAGRVVNRDERRRPAGAPSTRPATSA